MYTDITHRCQLLCAILGRLNIKVGVAAFMCCFVFVHML